MSGYASEVLSRGVGGVGGAGMVTGLKCFTVASIVNIPYCE